MDLNNIKRNQLDYILTDMLPTELSERFTFFYFYEFLMTKRKELKQMNNFLISVKNKYKTGVMFEGGGSGHGGHKGNNWVTMPLKYSIMKELHTEREISLLQPIAAVELFAFVSIYQKELINLLDMNSIFSLRHHHKNNELCYKNKNKSITKYFAVESAQIDKDLIEKSTCLFRTKEEQEIWLQKEKQNSPEKEVVPHILKSRALYYSKRSIMNQLNELICEYPSKDRTIVAYFLGTILNKVSRNKENVKIFSEHVTEQTVANFMDLIFYAYSFFPNYNNTQRFLSIVSYIRDEYDIFTSSEQLQKLVNKYAFIFDKANLNDIINLVLFCAHAKIEIPYRQEQMIVCKLREKDDPILWASYLLYSQYSTKYYKEIRDEIGGILLERIDAIIKKDSIYTYREFWWVIIFNKSPHLTIAEQSKVDDLINELKVSTATNLSAEEICGNLFVEFVKNNSRQFFEWDMEEKDFLRNYTFKTYERSIFKNYRENVTSLAWGSF